MHYDKLNAGIKRLYNDEKNNIIFIYKGSYILYNKYKVSNYSGEWHVEFKGIFLNSFESSKSALCWCLADNAMKYELATSIKTADHKLRSKKNNVIFLRSYLKQAVLTADKKEIATSRITYDLHVCNTIKRELDVLTFLAKYIKIKGFITNGTK